MTPGSLLKHAKSLVTGDITLTYEKAADFTTTLEKNEREAFMRLVRDLLREKFEDAMKVGEEYIRDTLEEL